MKMRQVLSTFIIFGLFSACQNDKADPWCDEHKNVHSQHADEITHLAIKYDDEGLLTAHLRVPHTLLSFETLNDATKVLNVQAIDQCKSLSTQVNRVDNNWQAAYKIDCGQDNKLKTVSVELLKNFENISEVEALIETSAATKHFILSRQCDSPIFVL